MDSERTFSRHTMLILMAVFTLIVTAGGVVFRPWWFDEVLTLTNFALLGSPLKIYQSYTIPNNQIVHSVVLHYLTSVDLFWGYLRFFPLICALLTVGLLYNGFRKECGAMPLTAVLGAWMLSAPFMIYATALRGYMLAALLVTLALLCGRKYIASGKISALAGWFAAAFFAVGVMPSAIAGIAAAGCCILPYCGKYFYRKRRFQLLAVTAAAAFVIFYAPIAGQLRAAAALHEGWHDHAAALLALVTALLAVFNFLLPAAIYSSWKSPWDIRKFSHLAIWLMPLGMFCFTVAPFPRVWWVIFPVLAITLARRLKNVSSLKYWWFVPVLLAFLTNVAIVKNTLSPYCSRSGQDDFFAPYFMQDDFSPQLAAEKAQTLPHTEVYASFDADPWSLLPFMNEELRFDLPGKKITSLSDQSVVILKRGENPDTITSRFGGRITQNAECGRFIIYLWREK